MDLSIFNSDLAVVNPPFVPEVVSKSTSPAGTVHEPLTGESLDSLDDDKAFDKFNHTNSIGHDFENFNISGITRDIESATKEEQTYAHRYYSNPWDAPESIDEDFPELEDAVPNNDDNDHNEGNEEEPVDNNNEGSNDDEFSNYKWDLRLGPRTNQIAFGHTYIDHDPSGTYDPRNETQTVPPRPKRAVAERNHESEQEDNAGKRPRPAVSWTKARQEGVCLPVVLKLSSNRGTELLMHGRNNGMDNWPEEPWNSLIDNPLEHEVKDLDPTMKYLLRSKFAEFRRDNENHVKAINNHSSGLLRRCQVVNLTGHPEGRGCKACYAVGQPCSMLEPDGEYPCTTCCEDGCECEPLIQPKVKRACNSCDKKACSYLNGGDHGRPCLQCEYYGFPCIAGPAIDPQRVRITEDGVPAFTVRELKKKVEKLMGKKKQKSKQSKKRKADTVEHVLDPQAINLLVAFNNDGLITESSSQEAWTTAKPRKTSKLLKVDHDIRPSFDVYVPRTAQSIGPSEFKRRGYLPRKIFKPALTRSLNSTRFYSSGRRMFERPARIPNGLPSRFVPQQSRHATPAREHPVTKHQGPPLMTKTILTKLAHPVTFNAKISPDKPCHFHTEACMPITGLGTTSARVHMWPSGAGYTELSNGGGHTSQGAEPTRICYSCTTSRVVICICRRHDMQPIAGQENVSLDVNEFLTAVLVAETQDEITDIHGKCCSVCPRYATWTCSADGSGCGLRLCEICNTNMTQVYKGNLQDMIKRMTRDEGSFPAGLRADAEFFGADGLMVKQLSSV